MLSGRMGYAIAVLLCTYAVYSVNGQQSTAATGGTTAAAATGVTGVSTAAPTGAQNTASTAAPTAAPTGANTAMTGAATTAGGTSAPGTTTAPPAPPSCNNTHCPKVCACTPTNIWLDIIVVVDVSSSMTTEGLVQTKSFLEGIINALTVSQMPGKNTRLAVVGFSNLTTVYKYLTDVNSTNDAVAAIDSIAYAGDQFVNLENALKTAGDVIRVSDKRPNAKNVILLITSANDAGPSNDPHPIASELKNQGNTIVTIAFAQSSTSTPPPIDWASPGYNFTNTEPNFTYLIGRAFCDINCFCPPLWIHFATGVIGTTSYTKYGECIYPGDLPTTWKQAAHACSLQNGYLMDELSADKQSFAKNQAFQLFQNANLGYWIGLNNQAGGGYVWDNGNGTSTPLDQNNDYSNWTPNYPQGPGQCVAEVRYTGFIVKWKNLDCNAAFTESHNYFCQIKSCDTDNYCLSDGSP